MPGFLNLHFRYEFQSRSVRFPSRLNPPAITRVNASVRGRHDVIRGRFGKQACMTGNLLGTIRLPISLSRSKHRIAALRQFRWLQHLSPIPDHSLQRDLNEAALRRTLRVAGQVPITSQKRDSRTSEREQRSLAPHFLYRDVYQAARLEDKELTGRKKKNRLDTHRPSHGRHLKSQTSWMRRTRRRGR